MAKTPTPHDSLFKSFMTTPETARDFLLIHLPSELRQWCDLDTLKLESCSFIEDSLRPYMSDVMYSMKTQSGTGYIYAIVEHQSSSDPLMAFRMTRYSIAAMQQHLDAGHKTLPIVIPFLFYHGRETPYPYSTNWLDCFENARLAQDIYTSSFPLIDLTVLPDNDIMQHKRIALLELIQKHIRQRDVRDILDNLVTLLLKGYTTDKQIRSLMEYMLQVGETQDFQGLVEELAVKVPEHEEMLMTIAEQLRQEGEKRGLMRGRQEGRQEGIQEAQLKIAKELLLAGLDRDMISKTTGLSLDDLAKLAN
ncbi:Rpn family recombination-promoting nuclease/putative transposase [Photobacterium damselae]|uniref:Rpn family recombination-promoting nuclease/putative transposase n=1 Tax=Photobacterium damselae TaxID=38293 RepID=UPI00406878EA